MNKLISFIILGFLFCSSIFANDTLQDKMIKEIDIIKNTFEVKYAPADWKKNYANWDLEEQAAIAKQKILSTPHITIKDFQTILRSFFAATRDYHVGVYFFSTESAFLPFRVVGANGRYFLTWFDRSVIPGTWQWNIGDEVTLFDNISTQQAIDNFKTNEMGNPESLTDQGYAELFLTARIGILGHKVPKGKIEITLKHLNGKTKKYPFEWSYAKEQISSGPFQAEAFNTDFISREAVSASHNFFHKPMIASAHKYITKAFLQSPYCDEGFDLIGSKKGFLPPLGKTIWQNAPNGNFYAYIYESPNGKKVGFVRIPDFLGDAKEVVEFSALLNRFEAQCDALVIDQHNNPGGDVFYMYALASMFAQTPFEIPLHRITITQQDVAFALEAVQELSKVDADPSTLTGEENEDNTISGYPITAEFYNGLLTYFNFILEEWQEGRCFTQPTALMGVNKLTQHPKGKFTKPVLILVNHLAFSCGDFFPAIMQDNKRAKIMGTCTAGAGGYVLSHQHPSRMGIAQYTFTGSIAERPDKNPLENLGVTPDISYALKDVDLQSNYKDYCSAINQAVENLINKK